MREFIDIAECAGMRIMHISTYHAPDSRLDYPGDDFDKWSITDDGHRIGEIEVQFGADEQGDRVATVRNVILYRPEHTGRGIGKQVYELLRLEYPDFTIRSSYSTNIVKGQESVGLSDQAINMWNSLVRSGAAEKIGGGRFHYSMK